MISNLTLISFAENNIHVHDLLTFQQITVLPKARGSTLFACDLQVGSVLMCKEIEHLFAHTCFFLIF